MPVRIYDAFPINHKLLQACMNMGMTRAQALWYILQHTVHFRLRS